MPRTAASIVLLLACPALVAGAAELPVVVTGQSRWVEVDADAYSEFGCNDFNSDDANAPGTEPWSDSVSLTALCDFLPLADVQATTSQTSAIAPDRFAATATITMNGSAGEYTDPETFEYFCGGATGRGYASYVVWFTTTETVAWRVTGSAGASGEGNGNGYVELVGPIGVFQLSGEGFGESGLLAPGNYLLEAIASALDDAFCSGIIDSSASFDFVLDLTDACPADFDDNDGVGFADLNTMLANWGPCAPAPCAWDLDEDGSVGFADLNLLLTAWGACPAL